MNRLIVIKDLMKWKSLTKYLEIGVQRGDIFFKIKSNYKIAVDPKFEFGKMRFWARVYNFPYNLFNKYFEVTSDDFFLKNAPDLFKHTRPDLIFIDGMHEYQYALRDIENALLYMPDNGVIIVHDCSPKTKEAGSSYKEFCENNYSGLWNGDVWKAILNLRCRRKDLNVFVLDCDHGLGIITKGIPDSILPYSLDEIDKFRFDDFFKNKQEWLNLKRPEYFYDFFKIKSGFTVRKLVKNILMKLSILPKR